MDEAEGGAKSTGEASPYIAVDPSWREDLTGTHALFDIRGYPAWEGVLTNTAGVLSRHNVAGFRMTRRGGAHPSDMAVHRSLFTRLGIVTLVSGHIEVEMKRILLTANAEPDSGFADVDLTWKRLEDKLAEVADGDDPLADKLRPTLAWGAEKGLRERRNAAVHSAWALYDVGHFEAARLPHKSDGETLIDDGTALAETGTLLREYLNRLQDVVKWPILVLPPLGDNVPIKEFSVDVAQEP